MGELAHLLTGILATMGMTILVVWPQEGPSAWIRDRLLRPLLPPMARGVLDCYICFGFWCGLALAPLGWWLYHEPWVWAGCLITPCMFWLVIREIR